VLGILVATLQQEGLGVHCKRPQNLRWLTASQASADRSVRRLPSAYSIASLQKELGLFEQVGFGGGIGQRHGCG
jgi:hypothetical protein